MCLTALNSTHGNINQLRAKATAKLARVEKDFTSTVVLSDNNMFVLPNINGLGKRNKKKPKRYNECLLMDGSMDILDMGEGTANDGYDRDDRNCSTFIDSTAELEKMRHARVHIPRINVLGSLEPWCMVHYLYRCFCKYEATSGKPFVMTEDNQSSKDNVFYSPPPPVETKYYKDPKWETIAPRKRQYTFEKGDVENAKKKKPLVVVESASSNSPDDNTSARCRPFDQTNRVFLSKCELQSLQRSSIMKESQYRIMLEERINKCRAFAAENQQKQRTAAIVAIAATKVIVIDDDDDCSTAPPAKKNEKRSVTSTSNTVDELMEGSSNQSSNQSSQPKPTLTTPFDATEHTRHVHSLNRIVSGTMRKIRDLQMAPVFELQSPRHRSLNSRRWSQMIEAYKSQRIFIWAVRFEAAEVLLAVTITNEMPVFRKASSISNIRVAETDSLPLLGKMLKKCIVNERTENLSKYRIITWARSRESTLL